MRNHRIAAAFVVAWTCVGLTAGAADWPQWRGPNRDGVSAEVLSVTNWPPKLVWTNSIALGESSIAVSEGRLYTMGRVSFTNLVYCLDASTGTNLWTQSYTTNGALNKYGIYGPQATPTVVGGEVYTFDDAGKLYCFNKTNGTVMWSKALGLNMPQYGFASSPLVDGDLILFNASGIGAAVSRTTHNVLWPTSSIPAGAAYASPVSMTVGGRKMFLVQTADALKAIATNGVVLWSYPYDSASVSGYAAADPVVWGDKILLYENGLVLLQAGTNSVSEVWSLNTDTCGASFSTPVIVGSYAYAVDYAGDLVRIDLGDGSVGWNAPGYGQGSMTAVDGKLVVLADGQLRVVKIGTSGFDEEGRLPVTVSEDDWMQYGWSPPAVYNGSIYCRVGRTLACYSVSGLMPGPSLNMDTNDVVVLCPVGTVATQVVSIVNAGDATLTWTLGDAFEGTNFTSIARQFKVAWSSPYSLKYDATSSNLWAHYYGSSDVRQIATNGTEVTTKSMGTNAYNSYGIEVDGGNLWGTHYNDKRFVKFNLNDMSVLQWVAYPSVLSYVYTMARGDGRMFAANSGSALYQLNPDTGAVLQTFTIPDSLNYNHHLGYSGGHLWWGTSATPYNRLVKWDPATGKVRSRFSIGGWQNGCSVYDVAASATNTQLWVLTYQHQTGLNERWAHLVDLSGIQRCSESSVSGAVPAGASVPLSLVFNGVGAAIGVWPVRLTIESNGGTPKEKLVTFVVHAPGANHVPTANAGTDQNLDAAGALTPVTLNGSGSDADGDTLRYRWTEGGVILAMGAKSTVNMMPGVHDMTLTVDDYRGGIATDMVRITINAPDIAFSQEPVVMLCPQGSMVTQSVTVLNVGNRPLNWTMTDQLSGTNWMRILRSFKVGWNLSPTTMKYDTTNNCLWASYYNSNEVAKLSTANGSVLARKYLTGCTQPYAIEVEGTNLWVANYSSTNFTCYRLSDMSVLTTVAQPAGWTSGAYGLAIGGGNWYATTSGTNICMLDSGAGTVLATYGTSDSFSYYSRHIGYGDGSLWWGKSVSPCNVLRRMDAASGTLASSIVIGQWSTSATIYDMSYAGTNGQYWALTYNHNGAYQVWAHLVDLGSVLRASVTETPHSGTIAAGGSAAIQVTFDGRNVTRGSYPVQLVFSSNDPDEPIATNTVMVVVHAGGANHPPVANAGPDRTENISGPTAPFFLDLTAGASSDPDGDPLRARWSTNGVPVALDENGLIELGDGTYSLTMTVDDYRGGTNTDAMTLTVHANVTPADWPQWYGPNGRANATLTNSNWLQNWPPVIGWNRSDIVFGSFGYSAPWNDNGSPIVSDGRVYFAPSGGMFCLDALTGATIWRRAFKGGNPTPVVDGDYVYACENNGDGNPVSLVCWNKYTGATNWVCPDLRISSGYMGNGDAGNCSSPMVHGDLVILNGTAINKTNGKVLWTRGSGLLLPQKFTWNARTYIFDNNYLIDPRTGANVIYAGQSSRGYIAFAVPYGNDKTWWVGGTYGGNGGSVYQIGGTTLWSTNNGGLNWFNAPVVVGDYGYFLDDVHGGPYDNAGGHIIGVDLRTGQKIFGPGVYTDTMIAVGDKLVTSGVEGGGVGIVDIGGTNYRPRVVFDLRTVLLQSTVSPYMIPAYANKRIYVMGSRSGLTCLFTGLSSPVVNNGAGAFWNESDNTAKLSGQVVNTGNGGTVNTSAAPTRVYAYWGRNDGGTSAVAWENCATVGARPVGMCSATVSGLHLDSVYYYRMYASNDVGGSWAPSSERFTTYSSGSPVTDSSLFLRWTFEERGGSGAADVTGNENNGTGTSIKYTNGIMGAALLMESATIQCSAFTTPLVGDFTFSFWWNLLTPRGGGADGESFVWINPGSGSSLSLAAGYERLYMSGGAGSTLVTTGRWYHVAITRQASAHTLYVDGRFVGVLSNAYDGTCTHLQFGGGGSTYMPRSCLDEVRIYRRALPLEDIDRLYSMALATNSSSTASNSTVQGSDDAEERKSDGTVFLSRPNLFLGRGDDADGSEITGLRFPGVGIPRGASVSSASIQFKAVRDFGGSNVVLTQAGIVGYGTEDTTNATATVSDGGAKVTVLGNAWKAHPFAYAITANTMMEFDFRSTSEGDVHGIGMDNQRATINTGRMLALYGTENRSGVINTWRDYSNSAPNVKHYTVTIGTKYTGAMTYVVFMGDDDTAPTNAMSEFSNIRVYEKNTQQTETACFTIRGQDSASPATFGAGVHNVSGRGTTGSVVEWRPPSWAANAMGSAQQTPDLSGIVEEMVCKTDWSQGNAIAFIVEGTGQRVADSTEKIDGTAACLRVTWTLKTDPLAIESAWSMGATNEVMVLFDRPVCQATAGSAINYRISGGISVLSATLCGDARIVRLATTGMTTGLVYRVTVSGVCDLAEPANFVAPGTEWLFTCMPGPVEFVTMDAVTMGNWRGVYGGDGRYAVAVGTAYYPLYAKVTVNGNSSSAWSSSTNDVRALQKDTGTDRYIGQWCNSGTNFYIDVDLTDGLKHQVALYFVDWDLTNRCQRVEVLQPGTGRIWDTRVLSTNSFTNGVWLVWNITGRQLIRFTDLNPSRRAVLCGIFLGMPIEAPGPDGNHNGIEDEWELKYYATTNHAASWFLGRDSDGDGMSDWAEFVAGTDPTNNRSYLVMGSVSNRTSGLVIRWASESNRTYSMELSTNLVTDWFTTSAAAGLPGTPPMNTYTDMVSRPRSVFYRIKVDW